MLGQPHFGQLLRELRQERNLSQTDLAGSVMSAGYLSRLESGARPPTEKIVRQLAQRLEVPLGVFQEKRDDEETEILARGLSAHGSEEAIALLAQELERQPSEKHGGALLRWARMWSLLRLVRASWDPERLIDLTDRLVALATETGVPELLCRSLTESARSRQAAGNMATACKDAREALHTATAHGLGVGDTARATLVVVSSEAEAGNLTDACTQADALLDLVADEEGTLPVEALWSAATVRVRQGDYLSARELLERALGVLDSHEGVVLWMRLRLAAASLYLQMTPREAGLAQRRLAEAEPALLLVGNAIQRQEFLLLSAQLAVHRGELDAARELCGRIDDNAQRLNFRDRLRIEVLRCQLRLLDGDVTNATHDMEGLAKQAQDAANVDLAAEVWRMLAETLTMVGTTGRPGSTV